MLAGLFPAVVMTILLVGAFAVALLISHHVPRAVILSGFTITLIGWVLIPGMALLVGVLPFLKLAPGESSRPVS